LESQVKGKKFRDIGEILNNQAAPIQKSMFRDIGIDVLEGVMPIVFDG
jgi:hypothetical protein